METEHTSPAAPGAASLENRRLAAIFLIGFVSLGYELLQVRMLSFFLGSISNFLAIPIALFGLALGSMYCHFVYRGDPLKLIARYLLLIFPVLAAVLIAFFFVANAFFPEIHLVVAYTYQLVPDLRNAFANLTNKYGKRLPSMISVITGPSRTADIEKTLVMGAHGPRELYLFLIDQTE